MSIDSNQSFEEKLRHLLNTNSMENHSNTHDFILSKYLLECLSAFNRATLERDRMYGVRLEPGRTTLFFKVPQPREGDE